MKSFVFGRSKDREGNSVTYEWTTINRKEIALIARMTKERDFEGLVAYPYGFTLMQKIGPDADVIDYCIVLSSEESIPERLVDRVSAYITGYTSSSENFEM